MVLPLYGDHNFARPAAAFLRGFGYDIVANRDIAYERAFDDEQLIYAARNGRVLLTHNGDDFELLHDAWRRWSIEWGVPRRHAGILVLPQEWPHERKAREIDRFLRAGPALANQLFRWKHGVGWEMRALRTIIT